MSEQNPNQPDGVWVSIPLSYLAVSRYKVAVSIREVVNLTNAFSRKYVAGCTAVLQKSLPKELSMQYRVTCTKPDSDPSGHEVRIKFDVAKVDSNTTLNDLDVKISCTCAAHVMWGGQWNLNQLDALEGTPRPLLQAPTQQLDKRKDYVLCKHVQVVIKRVIPAVSRVLKNLTRDLKLDEIHRNREEEIKREEEVLRQKEEKRLQDMKEFEQRNKRPVKPAPKEKALTEMQGPGPTEIERRRKLLEEEEERLLREEKKPGRKTQPPKRKNPYVKMKGVI